MIVENPQASAERGRTRAGQHWLSAGAQRREESGTIRLRPGKRFFEREPPHLPDRAISMMSSSPVVGCFCRTPSGG